MRPADAISAASILSKGAPPAAGAATRVCATRVVAAVMEGASLDAALEKQSRNLSSPADKALVAAMAYGVLRDWRLLNALVDAMVKKRPPSIATTLLCVGIYQLRSMRVAEHAAVHATVSAANKLRLPALRGLLNAILRRYQREADSLEAELSDDPMIIHSHPGWLGKMLQHDWPGDWESLFVQNNSQAPMLLRVNARQGTVDDYLVRLSADGIEAQSVPGWPQAVVLAQALPVDRLPGFDAGSVSVQDAAAQLAAPLLQVESDMRVLDACAAPGGKTAHLLETTECDLLALDIDAERTRVLELGLERLGLDASVMQADAVKPEDWWDDRPFDRILIDAPCTGTGVIRRHPDIKWLRRPEDVESLAARQRELLEALWPLLAPGGLLLFATCSTLRAEGSRNLEAFLQTHPDATELPIEAEWGQAEPVGRRIASGERGMDGFYYARLQKNSA